MAANRLKIDEPQRLLFAHSPVAAFFFTLIGAALGWVCWVSADEGATRWALVAFCLLFVAAGLAGAFWRLEIDIDLGTRRVRIRRGFWPSPKTVERSLDAGSINLRIRYRSSGSKNNRRKVPWWIVELKLANEGKPFSIHETRNEAEGYRKWEEFAERLRIDAVDATSGTEERRDWRDLDRNVAEQARDDEDDMLQAPAQPPASKIGVVVTGIARELVLPAPGFGGGLVFVLLFGGAFAGSGALILLANHGVVDIQVNGSRWALSIIPPVFLLLGLGVVWLGVAGSFRATILGVADGAFYKEGRLFGRRSGRVSVPLRDVESVDIRDDVSSRRRRGTRVAIGGLTLGGGRYRARESEVVVRSDEKILRFGRSLDAEDIEWLAGTCRYAVTRGRIP